MSVSLLSIWPCSRCQPGASAASSRWHRRSQKCPKRSLRCSKFPEMPDAFVAMSASLLSIWPCNRCRRGAAVSFIGDRTGIRRPRNQGADVRVIAVNLTLQPLSAVARAAALSEMAPALVEPVAALAAMSVSLPSIWPCNPLSAVARAALLRDGTSIRGDRSRFVDPVALAASPCRCCQSGPANRYRRKRGQRLPGRSPQPSCRLWAREHLWRTRRPERKSQPWTRKIRIHHHC